MEEPVNVTVVLSQVTVVAVRPVTVRVANVHRTVEAVVRKKSRNIGELLF